MNSFLEMLSLGLSTKYPTRDVLKAGRNTTRVQERSLVYKYNIKGKSAHVRFMEIDELGCKECVRRKM